MIKCKYIGEPTHRLNTNHFYLYKKNQRKVSNKDEYYCDYDILFIDKLPHAICCCTGSKFFEDNFIDVQQERKQKLEKLKMYENS